MYWKQQQLLLLLGFGSLRLVDRTGEMAQSLKTRFTTKNVRLVDIKSDVRSSELLFTLNILKQTGVPFNNGTFSLLQVISKLCLC